MLQFLSSPLNVLYLTTVFLFAGILVSNAEYLWNYRIFSSEGILDWKIIRFQVRQKWGRKFIGLLFQKKVFAWMFILRAVTLVTIFLVPLQSPIYWGCLLFLAGIGLIINQVTHYGSDGSDQMSNIVLYTLCLVASPFATENHLLIGFGFIAIQACLSYFIAGFAKLVSSTWRSGAAVRKIFKTRSYGSEQAYNYLKDRKTINLLLCWNVILIEMSFPLVLFLPMHFAVLFLIWGITFHLLNALVMGLNTFLWAFLATYPSIIFFNLYLMQ